MKAKRLITYYDILGIKKTANPQEIKRAYWIKAKSAHPDLNKNSTSANKEMIQINKAYQTLIDPIQRAAYDERILVAFNKRVRTTKKTNYNQTNQKSYENKNDKKNSSSSQSYSYSKSSQNSSKRKLNFQYGYIVIVGIFILIGLLSSNNKNLSSNSTNVFPTDTPIPAQAIYPTLPAQRAFTNQYYQYQYPTPTPIPTIDCVGPDGKHLYVTQQECDAFNAAWRPTPTPITGCGPNATDSYGYCYCNSGFTKNYTTGQCEKLVCPPNSTESYGSCLCNNGFQKNYTTGQCDPLNCPANSTVYYNSCLCNSGFYKDYISGQCMPYASQ